MTRVYLLLLLLAVVAGGCCGNKPSGDREFIPGKGWMPVR
jgi:hypothetical protein